MGLLSGAASVTRYNVTRRPKTLDFEREAFREIDPGSDLRHSHGFLPMEPGAEYQIGTARWAFRVRMDHLKADPTLLKERFRELVRVEIEAGAKFVGARRRRELRELAEEELIAGALPTTRILEGCIDGDILYVGSTTKAYLGIVTELLRKVGVHTEFKTPWIDRGDAAIESDVLSPREPGQSVLGCRLLKELVGDSEVTIEPESGYVALHTPETRVTMSGVVFHDLLHFLEQEVELVAAKMIAGESTFRFDALSYRLSSLKIETGRHEHWTEQLDERLEKISAIFELLDRKFFELGLDAEL